MTPIFHISHWQNLERIIESGCLWCDHLATRRGANPIGIAHNHIKERRARRVVPLAAGGTLAHYVPFYFAPRSPMLCAIYNARVQEYTGKQREVVHLVSTVELATELGLPWCFTEGHAEIAYSEFFDSLGDLGKIDWKIMKARFWAGSEEDKRRRQAEFLVYQRFPWEGFRWIAVHDEEMGERVRGVVGSAEHKPMVLVRRDFYYP